MKVLHNTHNSKVNAEYHCNKYSNEVLTECLQVIFEQMLWARCGKWAKEGCVNTYTQWQPSVNAFIL